MFKCKSRLLGAAAAAALVLAAPVGQALAAEKVALRTVSAFVKNATVARPFMKFVEAVNSDADAPVRIDLIGGPEAMPPFQIGNAVRTGVVDVIFAPGAFYGNVMPSAETLKLTRYSPQELREMGRWDDLQAIWREQMNAHYLAFTNYGNRFHLYTNKPIQGADLTGQRLRVTPIYRAFFQDLGATVMQTAPGEVYTALERGVVDGYGWPVQGVFDFGWQEHTQYRVEPGFYQVEVSVLVNQDKWAGLTQAQRDYLTEKAIWLESLNANNERLNEEERVRQEKAGIKSIELSGDDREKFLKRAHATAWAAAMEQDADTAKRIRAIIDK